MTGGSYGGGVSLDLAVLRDRVMLQDGTLAPWTSPAGAPMRIAGAVPWIPWSDLVYALTPNGRTLDYEITSPTADLEPFGIVKQSFVAGLYASGQASGYYAPPGADPGADLTRWFAQINAGEPYGADERAIADELAAHHSPYYLDHSRAPAPTLIAVGLDRRPLPRRRGRALLQPHPRAVPRRAAVADVPRLRPPARRRTRTPTWRASSSARTRGWTATSRATRPRRALRGRRGADADLPEGRAVRRPVRRADVEGAPPRRGPLHERDPADRDLARRRPDRGARLRPDRAATARARRRSARRRARHGRLPPAGRDRRRLHAARRADGGRRPEAHGHVPARWHCACSTWRPTARRRSSRAACIARRRTAARSSSCIPGAWRFAPGHVAKLQLLGRDAPYGRASNGTFTVEVRSLELRLPVRERRGAQVRRPLAAVPGGEPVPR